MELDRRKTGIIIVAVAAIIGITLLLVAVMMPGDDATQEEVRNVYIEHPDADVAELSESKLDAYAQNVGGRSSVEDYWDSIEQTEAADDDPLSELNGGGGSGYSGAPEDDLQKLRRMTEERQKGQTASTVSSVQQSGTSSAASSAGSGSYRNRSKEEIVAEYMEQRRSMEEDIISQVMETYQQNTADTVGQQDADTEAVMEEEPVRIQTEKPVVRQSGVISSLDDGWSSGGISSLDGPVESVDTDMSHPFKCMFVREEKIESGQRVSVRLLEDMVVGGMLIPRNTHLMAVCSIGSRLEMKVTSIEMNGRIYSLNYEAYDNDGMKGIYCPDVETQAKEQAKSGTFSLGRRTASRMGAIAGEIAGIGMTIAETVASGTKRTVKVPQGYTFYLVQKKD